MLGFKNHYYIVRKSDGKVWQYINSAVDGWNIDNETDYSISLDKEYKVFDVYHNRETNTFFQRIWNKYTEEGIPDESAGFTDVEWIPN